MIMTRYSAFNVHKDADVTRLEHDQHVNDMDTRLLFYLQQRVDNIKCACDVSMLININTQD
jgi:hypothetical protein